MKKHILLIAALVGGLFFASCGGNKDANIMKQVDELYTQAEDTVKTIDDINVFFDFLDELAVKRDDFLHQVLVPAYSVGDSLFQVPDAVSSHMYERATAYNQVEAEKFAELFEPFMANLESATEAACQARTKAERKVKLEKAIDAYKLILPFADYDNVLPELKARETAVLDKLDPLL